MIHESSICHAVETQMLKIEKLIYDTKSKRSKSKLTYNVWTSSSLRLYKWLLWTPLVPCSAILLSCVTIVYNWFWGAIMSAVVLLLAANLFIIDKLTGTVCCATEPQTADDVSQRWIMCKRVTYMWNTFKMFMWSLYVKQEKTHLDETALNI